MAWRACRDSRAVDAKASCPDSIHLRSQNEIYLIILLLMLSHLSSLKVHAGHGSNHAATVVLFLVTFAATVGTSYRHSLTTSATAWLAICIFTWLKTKPYGLSTASHAQILAWVAGGLLALASVCERSVIRKDIWWAKVNYLKANIQDSD